MLKYQITCTEIHPEVAAEGTQVPIAKTIDVYTQIIPETQFNLPSFIKALNPTTRKRRAKKEVVSVSSIKKNLDTTRMLRIVYTDAERLELGKKLSEEFNELRAINSDFDRVKANFKSKITSREANIEDLSNKVSTGYHIADVKCRWELATPTKLEKSLFRLDTGELVEVAEMVAADLQAEMELNPPEPTPPPATEPTPEFPA